MNIINFTPLSAFVGGITIGLAVVVFFIGNGRLAGISGITDNFFTSKEGRGDNFLFLVGLIIGPIIFSFSTTNEIPFLITNSLPLIIHSSEPVGHMYPGKGTTYPENIYKFIKLFPDNTIILAHWGGGILFYELMEEVKEISKNVYYDTAASSFLYNPKIFELAIEIVGSEKIIFGSDFPILSPKRILNEMKNLKEQDLMNITEKNIKNILNLN